MKNKKIITTVITLIALIGVIFVSLSACGKSSETDTNEATSATTTETTSETTTVPEPEDVAVELPEYYNKVVEEYRAEDSEEPFYYALHDIDENGIPELFISTFFNDRYDFYDIYTYADEEVYPLFGEYFGIAVHGVYENGTVTSYSSDECCKYWTFLRIGKDGHTLVTMDRINIEDYNDEAKIKYFRDVTDYDNCVDGVPDSNIIEISEEQFNLIGKAHVGHEPEEPEEINEIYQSQTDINFNWIAIEAK